MNAETFFNNGVGEDCEKVHKNHVIQLMQNFAEHYHTEQLRLYNVVGRSEHLVCPDCKDGRDPFDPNWLCPECRQKEKAN